MNSRYSVLRTRAEAVLASRPSPPTAHADNELLLHELQVHQIELELQNEDLRQAQLDVEDSRDHYLYLYESAPVGYLTLDLTGTIAAANLTARTMLGAGYRKVQQTRFATFVAPADRDRWLMLLTSIKREAVANSCELALEMVGDSALEVRVDCLATSRNGKADEILVTLTGITAGKAAERERAASAERLAQLGRHLLTAQEDARRQLAADLHQRTSASLAAITISLEVAARALQQQDYDEAGVRIEDVTALIEDTTNSVREICSHLRPPALDHAGLAYGMRAYASEYSRRTNIAVQFDCAHSEIRKAPELESILFRIFQEALTNAAKHAGCSAIAVNLQLNSAPMVLTLKDNGRGFDPKSCLATRGQGVISMREMAEYAGGRFRLKTLEGRGTEIAVEI